MNEFIVSITGGSKKENLAIAEVLQRVADDFLARPVVEPHFSGFGLHIRGCSCNICDGSGGVPGGLIVACAYVGAGEAKTTPRKEVCFHEIQVGDRILLDMRDDPVAKAIGLLKKEIWGVVIDCHAPDGWNVAVETGLSDGTMGLVYRLTRENLYRVMDLLSQKE